MQISQHEDFADDRYARRLHQTSVTTVNDVVFIPTERGTSHSRCVTLVTLTTRDAVERAMAEMDQAPVDGRTIMSINQVLWDNGL
jgi:hypothetical protein